MFRQLDLDQYGAYTSKLDRRSAWSIGLVAALWFALALTAGLARVYWMAPAWAIGATVWALVASVLIAFWTWSPFRAWVLGLDLRSLVLFHTVRFVGIAFLIQYARGILPYEFAVPAGWGDIIVAVAAIGVALHISRRAASSRTIVHLWNWLGLIDILFAVATALRLALADRGSMEALTRLPLSLLPTFFVPLIIASHVVIFVRLRAGRRLAFEQGAAR